MTENKTTKPILEFAKTLYDNGYSRKDIIKKVNTHFATNFKSRSIIARWVEWNWKLPNTITNKLCNEEKPPARDTKYIIVDDMPVPVRRPTRGNPDKISKYKKTYHDTRVIDLIINNYSYKEIAKEFKISYRALYNWMAKHQSFKESCTIGMSIVRSKVMAAHAKLATGYRRTKTVIIKKTYINQRQIEELKKLMKETENEEIKNRILESINTLAAPFYKYEYEVDVPPNPYACKTFNEMYHDNTKEEKKTVNLVIDEDDAAL